MVEEMVSVIICNLRLTKMSTLEVLLRLVLY